MRTPHRLHEASLASSPLAVGLPAVASPARQPHREQAPPQPGPAEGLHAADAEALHAPERAAGHDGAVRHDAEGAGTAGRARRAMRRGRERGLARRHDRRDDAGRHDGARRPTRWRASWRAMGGELSVTVGPDRTTRRRPTSCPSAGRDAVRLLADVVQRPRLPEAELRARQGQPRARARDPEEHAAVDRAGAVRRR